MIHNHLISNQHFKWQQWCAMKGTKFAFNGIIDIPSYILKFPSCSTFTITCHRNGLHLFFRHSLFHVWKGYLSNVFKRNEWYFFVLVLSIVNSFCSCNSPLIFSFISLCVCVVYLCFPSNHLNFQQSVNKSWGMITRISLVGILDS